MATLSEMALFRALANPQKVEFTEEGTRPRGEENAFASALRAGKSAHRTSSSRNYDSGWDDDRDRDRDRRSPDDDRERRRSRDRDRERRSRDDDREHRHRGEHASPSPEVLPTVNIEPLGVLVGGTPAAAGDFVGGGEAPNTAKSSFVRPPLTPTPPVDSDSIKAEVTAEIAREKQGYLIELEKLKRQGVVMTRQYTMADALEDIQFEYDSQRGNLDTLNAVNLMRDLMQFGFQGIEMANGKWGPVLQLDGWSKEVG